MRPGACPSTACVYMRTMQEMDGAEHLRLRRLVAPAFTPRRTAGSGRGSSGSSTASSTTCPADGGPVDLLADFARPLPIDVICELVGIPEADRAQWREYGAAVASGSGEKLRQRHPRHHGGREAGHRPAAAGARPRPDLRPDPGPGGRRRPARRRRARHPGVAARPGRADADRTSSPTPSRPCSPIPDQLGALRADPGLMPRAVEELTRWCGPQLLAIPRFPSEDVEVGGVPIPKGDARHRRHRVRQPRPARLSRPRPARSPPRPRDRRDISAYAHGPHFCLGAPLARLETEVALGALLRRFPGLSLAAPPARLPDPGTWRLASLRHRLAPAAAPA